MQRFILPTAAILAALASADVSAQSIKDTIVTTSGKRIRGVEVSAMTSSTVKFKRGENEDELPAASVADVQWHEPPEQFVLARSALKNGQFENAVSLFEEAQGKTERDFIKLSAEFYGAQAMLRGAGKDSTKAGNAAAKLKEFLDSNDDSYFAAEARLELGRAELLAGNPGAAESTLSQLGNLVAANGLDPMWDLRAKFEIAKAQLAQGKLPDARSSFRRVKNSAESVAATAPTENPEVTAMIAAAVVGEGETFVAEQKYADALRYFTTLERNDNPSIAAAAKAGKGEALFLQAESSGKKDTLRSAQIVLAEASVTDPVGGPTTAKALYYSGKVILALGSERESQDFQVRANDFFKTVVKHYADTPWAARAAAELK